MVTWWEWGFGEAGEFVTAEIKKHLSGRWLFVMKKALNIRPGETMTTNQTSGQTNCFWQWN